ncbi:PEP-CTERM motif protein [mine drainage metagenome]|uniref:PEP-CTERM motif protein n=1 Tax=mine drainage metagenome TaxID=410659 RepID=A0A1J5S4Z9_9ZZZZ
MNTRNYVSVTLAALLSLLCSVVNADGYYNPSGGCDKTPTSGNTAPCGTLTVKGTSTTTTSNFLSNIKQGANQITTPSMYQSFNQAPFTNNNFLVKTGTLEVGSLGKGYSSGIVTFTYLGASAGNTDLFTVGSSSFNNKSSAVGSTITETVTSIGNVLNFSFSDTSYPYKSGAVGILSQLGGYTIGGSTYSDLLLYNDPGSGDRDFNDMVIGVNINCPPVPVSPVPEPKTYAMLLAGLGLVGFTALRRKHKFTV